MKNPTEVKLTQRYIDEHNIVIELDRFLEPVEIGRAVMVHSKRVLGNQMRCGQLIAYQDQVTKGTNAIICKKCQDKIMADEVKALEQQYSLF